MNAAGNFAQPFCTVIGGIKACDVGQKRLGGTDVGGRFLAADMLLAGLHRHTQRRIATAIFGDADNASWNRALELVGCSKERRVRATKAHGHAKALGVAYHNVSAQSAGLFQKHKAQKVGGHTGHDVAVGGRL